MENKESYIQDLAAIRQYMERSSRYMNLSGLSGVLAGIYALIGAAAAYWVLYTYSNYRIGAGWQITTQKTIITVYLVGIAAIVLALALGTGVYLSHQRAKKEGRKLIDSTARKTAYFLLVPLMAGGLLGLMYLWRGHVDLTTSLTLVFYGVGLFCASHYTVKEIRVLALAEIVLGLVSTAFVGYGLIFWALGFGVLHIIVGLIMYNRYEKG